MNPGRIWLTVPYNEKDDAKKVGARWNPVVRRWWISPSNLDRTSSLNSEWLNSTGHTLKVKKRLNLLIANHTCSQCKQPSKVVGLLATHVYELDPECSHRSVSQRSRDPVYLSDIRTIGEVSLQAKIDALCPYFWPNRFGIYRNHCEKCGKEFHDSDELYAPGGPLVPSENQNSENSFEKISLKLESTVGFDAGLRWIWNDRHDLFKSILRKNEGRQKNTKEELKRIYASFGRPYYVEYGFCPMCDSHITGDFCEIINGSTIELRHRYERLRQSHKIAQIKILEDATRRGKFSPRLYKKKAEGSPKHQRPMWKYAIVLATLAYSVWCWVRRLA